MDILKQLRDVCLMNAGLEFIVDTDASGEELETIPFSHSGQIKSA